MFKISIAETHSRRTLVLEGTLVHPWTAEVERAWGSAHEQLQGRKLIIDLRNVTLISPDGEKTLLSLMKKGAKFHGRDVFTRHLLRKMERESRCVQ